MLSKPVTCAGCPLQPLSSGFMRPSLAKDPYGVTLLGEALGEDEADLGLPFVGRAGFKLTRLIEWAGLDRARFDILNAVWCRPPNNLLDGQPYEAEAVGHCRANHWQHLLARSRVIVPMGNVPLSALTGRKGILKTRGYVRGGPLEGTYTLPTVHPSFIQRGQSKYSAAVIHDLQKAVTLARDGFPIEFQDYLLDPPAGVAYQWAQRAVEVLRGGGHFLAYDIETPGKDEDEGELDDDTDPTFTIYRISFSYTGLSALSVPWAPEYFSTIRLLLGGAWPKVVWNAGFDNPRIKSAGVTIGGLVHDGMVAWHILHSDLPKGLGFVATFCCPWQPEWKHLSSSRPAFYNATDADVELRSWLAIASELRYTGLWDVYERDVIKLDPVLRFMETQGMPLDPAVRLDRAIKLAEAQASTMQELEAAVPISARRYTPKEGYAKAPLDADDRTHVRITVNVRTKRCPGCGALNPTKPHFRAFKKPTAKRPQNPCAGLDPTVQVEPIERWARLEAFKPSREQLMRYQQVLGRPIPRTRDKKTGLLKPTMDKKALKELAGKHPLDRVYPAVLRYRDYDKMAGTYIGRPA